MIYVIEGWSNHNRNYNPKCPQNISGVFLESTRHRNTWREMVFLGFSKGFCFQTRGRKSVTFPLNTQGMHPRGPSTPQWAEMWGFSNAILVGLHGRSNICISNKPVGNTPSPSISYYEYVRREPHPRSIYSIVL